MRLALIVSLLFTAMRPCVAIAQNDNKTAKKLLLGFDPRQIRPPDPAKGKPLARVFDRYIDPVALKASSANLTQSQADQLSGLIIGPLFDRYAKEKKITVTAKDIDGFYRGMNTILGKSDFPQRANFGKSKDAETKKTEREIAERSVKNWKLSKALYEQYGGTVIFQQANPLEPVGAYRQFLEQMEKGRVFEVFDDSNRKIFWHYFRRKHPSELSPEDINYAVPWWLQKHD
jgi:hypothetical protein